MDPETLSSFVPNLNKLPKELVYRILDHLTLLTILRILTERNEHVNICIYTHLKLRDLFRSFADIELLTKIFELWWEIFDNYEPSQYIHVDVYQYNRAIDPDASPGAVYKSTDYPALKLSEVRDSLSDRIKQSTFVGTYDYSPTRSPPVDRVVVYDLLKPYATGNFPNALDTSYETLLAKWKWIMGAKFKLRVTNIHQWNNVTKLLSAYPGMAMTKKPLDPSQGAPRPNIPHIMEYFRRNATKALKERSWYPESLVRRRCARGIDCIQLVPYDRCLWYFLDMMQKHPIESNISVTKETLQDPSVDKPTKIPTTSSSPGTPFEYPEDISKNIKTVLAGMTYIYTGSPLLVLPRINWTPAAIPDSLDYGKPVFITDHGNHSTDLPSNLHRCQCPKRVPHCDKEYEWLESFLKVIAWMEETFGKVDEKGLFVQELVRDEIDAFWDVGECGFLELCLE